jgi:hypothetical protein
MALQGEAKKLYHREYMRRRRAGLPTRGVVKPKVMEQWCSECVLPPSPERIVVSFGSGYRLCQRCHETELCSPRSAPCVKRCGRRATTGEASAPNGERKASAGSSVSILRKGGVFCPAWVLHRG